MSYRLGQKVMLICRQDEGYPALPPVGAVGEITMMLDKYSEYDVLFPDYPCPVSEPDWVIHCSCIIPIDDSKISAIPEKTVVYND